MNCSSLSASSACATTTEASGSAGRCSANRETRAGSSTCVPSRSIWARTDHTRVWCGLVAAVRPRQCSRGQTRPVDRWSRRVLQLESDRHVGGLTRRREHGATPVEGVDVDPEISDQVGESRQPGPGGGRRQSHHARCRGVQARFGEDGAEPGRLRLGVVVGGQRQREEMRHDDAFDDALTGLRVSEFMEERHELSRTGEGGQDVGRVVGDDVRRPRNAGQTPDEIDATGADHPVDAVLIGS